MMALLSTSENVKTRASSGIHDTKIQTEVGKCGWVGGGGLKLPQTLKNYNHVQSAPYMYEHDCHISV